MRGEGEAFIEPELLHDISLIKETVFGNKQTRLKQ